MCRVKIPLPCYVKHAVLPMPFLCIADRAAGNMKYATFWDSTNSCVLILMIFFALVNFISKMLTVFEVVDLFRNCWPFSKLLTFFEITYFSKLLTCFEVLDISPKIWIFSFFLTFFDFFTFFKIVSLFSKQLTIFESADLLMKLLTFFKIVNLFQNCWPFSNFWPFS